MTSDLATAACRQALERAGVAAGEVDLIVCATATPDETFPATATRVQAQLGMTAGAAFDVQAVCSGLRLRPGRGRQFPAPGPGPHGAGGGGRRPSAGFSTGRTAAPCVLFGDGAGALLLRAETGNGANTDRGVLSTHLYSDGRHHDALYVDGGPSSTQTTGHLRMEGREVFRHAVVRMAEAIDTALAANDLTPGDIDWLVAAPGQRADQSSRWPSGLNLPMDRVVVTVDRHANTSAASIPLALDQAASDGRLQGRRAAATRRHGRRLHLGLGPWCAGRSRLLLLRNSRD